MMSTTCSKDGVSRTLVKGDADRLRDTKVRKSVDQVECLGILCLEGMGIRIFLALHKFYQKVVI